MGDCSQLIHVIEFKMRLCTIYWKESFGYVDSGNIASLLGSLSWFLFELTVRASLSRSSPLEFYQIISTLDRCVQLQNGHNVRNRTSLVFSSDCWLKAYQPWRHCLLVLNKIINRGMAADNIRRSLTSNPRFREWKAAYIATQAPLPETKFDGFWSMVWKQRVSVITYEITKNTLAGDNKIMRFQSLM